MKLTKEKARLLAGKLTTIGHPFLAEALDATAADLMGWCPNEEQATLLVEVARTDWKKGWLEMGGTAGFRELYQQLFETPSPEFKPWEAPPPPACAVCNDTGWESFERHGNTYARPCTACAGPRKPITVCPDCGGKESRLVDGRREPCNTCLSPQRRQQIGEWLKHQREAS